MKSTHMSGKIASFLLAAASAYAATAGPDAAGYLATDATAYSFVNIAGTGTRILAQTDDDTAVISLPFPFRFYGQDYSSVCISSNGLLSFGGCATGDFANVDIASEAPGGHFPAVAAFWTDLTLDGPGADAVYYQTLGVSGSRQFIVQWNSALPLGAGSPVTFQAILFEGAGRILVQYLDVDAGAGFPASQGGTATVGIRDAGGEGTGRRLQWSFNAPVIRSQQALEFRAPAGTGPACPVTLTPATASFNPGGGDGTFTISLASGCSWQAVASAPWIVVAAPGAGSGNGIVRFTVAANNSQAPRSGTIAVGGTTFAVAQAARTLPATLSVEPERLAFAMELAGAAPPRQRLVVNSSGQATFAVSTGNTQWLRVTPAAGSTPAVLEVGVEPKGLGVGDYFGAVTVAEPGGDSVVVQVSLTVSAKPVLRLNGAGGSPVNAMRFEYTAGGDNPAPQTANVTASVRNLNFTAASSVKWLTVAASAAATPARLTVSVNPAGLAPGEHQGSIAVASADAASVSLPVTLRVREAPPRVAAAGVVNGASFQPGPVAPGEIVSIFGAGMGPDAALGPVIEPAGRLATRLGDTAVYFDGIAAPLIAAQAGQINAVVPYGVAGKTTVQVEVECRGARSAPVTVPVSATAPALWTRNSSGRGQGSILNSDLTGNGETNPAAPGSVIVLYATGEGATSPAGKDGQVMQAGSLTVPMLPVSVRIGGIEAEVLYAGSAPGMVAGVLQVNVRVPNGTGAGPVPIRLNVGQAVSPDGVTVSLRAP